MQYECSASKEDKLWGGRFEESVTDAVEKFTESISFVLIMFYYQNKMIFLKIDCLEDYWI